MYIYPGLLSDSAIEGVDGVLSLPEPGELWWPQLILTEKAIFSDADSGFDGTAEAVCEGPRYSPPGVLKL
jgi:hypothetical protein